MYNVSMSHVKKYYVDQKLFYLAFISSARILKAKRQLDVAGEDLWFETFSYL